MCPNNKYGISKNDFFMIINLLCRYSDFIEQVILFGSRTRGDYKDTSDIDLAVKFQKESDILFQIADDISQLNLIYTFDLINYDKINNEKLKTYIDNEGKTIFLTNSKGEVISSMNKIKDKLSDLEKAFTKLTESLERNPEKDDIVIDASIQRFEFTYELSWKLMKAYLEYNGAIDVNSPRQTMKQAFKAELIQKGNIWIRMLEDRNRTSHPYDELIAMEIYQNIKNQYHLLFKEFLQEMHKRVNELS